MECEIAIMKAIIEGIERKKPETKDLVMAVNVKEFDFDAVIIAARNLQEKYPTHFNEILGIGYKEIYLVGKTDQEVIRFWPK